jgi:hypothetical protein
MQSPTKPLGTMKTASQCASKPLFDPIPNCLTESLRCNLRRIVPCFRTKFSDKLISISLHGVAFWIGRCMFMALMALSTVKMIGAT